MIDPNLVVVNRFKLESYLRITAQGRIFSIFFTKKDGSLRRMLCRFKVAKGVKGIAPKGHQWHLPYICVYDMVAGGHRQVNLETVISGRAGGKVYATSDALHYIFDQKGTPNADR